MQDNINLSNSRKSIALNYHLAYLNKYKHVNIVLILSDRFSEHFQCQVPCASSIGHIIESCSVADKLVMLSIHILYIKLLKSCLYMN